MKKLIKWLDDNYNKIYGPSDFIEEDLNGFNVITDDELKFFKNKDYTEGYEKAMQEIEDDALEKF